MSGRGFDPTHGSIGAAGATPDGDLNFSASEDKKDEPNVRGMLTSALLCCSAKAAWVQHPAVRFSGGATVPRAAVAATATEADPSAVKEEKYEFEAEVSKVMDIIINSLYSDKVRPP